MAKRSSPYGKKNSHGTYRAKRKPTSPKLLKQKTG